MKLSKRRMLMISWLMLIVLLTACGKQTKNEWNDIGEVTTESIEEPIEENPALVAEPMPHAEEFAGGSGTEADPYQIATAEQLALLSYYCTEEGIDYLFHSKELGLDLVESYFILTDDIELNDISNIDEWGEKAPKYAWTPIGSYWSFNGHFDGQGHTISGMYIYNTEIKDTGSPALGNLGLFGDISQAEIRNVTVKDSYIHTEGALERVGGIVADSVDSRVDNCISEVRFETRRIYWLGGVVGESWNHNGTGIVSNCTYKGKIIVQEAKGFCHIGGVIGDAMTDVYNCRNQGVFSIDEIDGDIGGIMASAGGCTIQNCINETDILIETATVGGIIGQTSSVNLVVSDCENKGDIVKKGTKMGEGGTGGIIGYMFNQYDKGEESEIIIDNCLNTGSITDDMYAGGIVGNINMNNPYTIQSCKNSGEVTSEEIAGGIIGQITPSKYIYDITDCTNDGTVSTQEGSAGGIVGKYFGSSLGVSMEQAENLRITQCCNQGCIKNENGIGGIGGIMGSTMGDEKTVYIQRCVNEGAIEGGEVTRAGGILGDCLFSLAIENRNLFCVEIDECVNLGHISQGDGMRTFDINALSVDNGQDFDIEKESELKTSAAEDAAVELLSGSSIGGIVGYCKNMMIKNSINCGEISIDSNSLAVTDQIELLIGVHQDREENSSGYTKVFAGGVCGAYYATNDDGEELLVGEALAGVLGLKNCIYSEPAPCAASNVLGQTEETIDNVRRTDLQEAMAEAEKLMDWR